MHPNLVSDLVRPLFWATQGNGTVAMLHCYFDDSGTHAGAPFVVWGGLIGKPEAFDKLNVLWVEILKSPMPSKTSIRKMRMSSLCSSQGDFVGYTPAERDVLRKRFRDAILECDLEAVAYVVNSQDWLDVSTQTDRAFLGEAPNFAFGGILEAVAALAKIDSEGVSCFLDAGAQNIGTVTIQKAWQSLRSELFQNCFFTYSPVESMPALQAADLIAYEAYHYGLHQQNPDKVSENIHFVRLREGMNVLFQFLERREMLEFLSKWRVAMASVLQSFEKPD